jgi:hypothetical protein
LHVKHHARGRFRTRVAQKCRGRPERPDLVPFHRSNQTLGGSAEQRIVVDNDYDRIRLNHVPTSTFAGKAHGISATT